MSAFASIEDLTSRLAGGLKEADEARAQAVLDDASALIRAETGKDWASDVPEIVHTVTLWVAMRAMQNPDGVTQEAVGTYSYAVANPSTDVYLTSNERRLVRRAAGFAEVGVVPTSRGDVLETHVCDQLTGAQYLPVDPEGDKHIPFAGPDGY